MINNYIIHHIFYIDKKNEHRKKNYQNFFNQRCACWEEIWRNLLDLDVSDVYGFV